MTGTTSTTDDGKLSPLYAAHLATLEAHLASALDETPHDALCVFAGTEATPPRRDTPYPFRVEPFFNWWVPLPDAAGSAVLVRPGCRPKLFFLQPDDYWHAPPADPQGFYTAHLDIEIVTGREQLAAALRACPPQCAALGEPGDLAGLFSAAADHALLKRLEFARAVKTPYEVECLAAASSLAARGHAAADGAFASGASEFELFLAYCAATAQRGAEMPYDPIVALDRHAAILHYQHLDRRPGATSRLLLLDAGASVRGYGSDVTRTSVRGAPEVAGLRDAVDDMQQRLCSELRAGDDFVELNARAHVLLAGILAAHGLLRRGVTAEAAFTQGVTRTFLPHGLGHLLGLAVHDVGGRQVAPDGAERLPPAEHPFLRLTRRVEPGFVVTIEPGLYFIPSLLRTMAPAARALVDWDVVERFLPFGGIRIEDDVLVERDGVRNLTREALARTVQP